MDPKSGKTVFSYAPLFWAPFSLVGKIARVLPLVMHAGRHDPAMFPVFALVFMD